MLRKSLIAIALLGASTAAMASDDRIYARVVTVEPQFVFSFGSRHHDGFRVRYEVGGQHYWTHSHHHPGQVIWVAPPPRYYGHHPRHHYKRHYKHHPRYGHGYRHDGWDD